jgi:hypothetical protein
MIDGKAFYIDASARTVTEASFPQTAREKFSRLSGLVGAQLMELGVSVGPTGYTSVLVGVASKAETIFSIGNQRFRGNAVVIGPEYRVGPQWHNAHPELSLDEFRAMVSFPKDPTSSQREADEVVHNAVTVTTEDLLRRRHALWRSGEVIPLDPYGREAKPEEIEQIIAEQRKAHGLEPEEQTS